MSRFKAVVSVSALLFAVILQAQLSTEDPAVPDAASLLPALPPLNLPLVPPSLQPRSGYYFSAAHENWPPLPFSYRGTNCEVYSMAASLGLPADAPYFVVDDRAIVAVELLLAATMDSDGPPVPGAGGTNSGGGDFTNYYSAPVWGSNDLFLTVLDVASNAATLHLHYPEPYTNSFTNWFIYGTTNIGLPTGYGVLNATNWVWVATTDTNTTNVTVNLLSSPEAYFKLSSSLDLDGDGIPDDWEWAHFGTIPQSAEDDFDNDGTNNGLEYTNGTDPNTIAFTAHLAYGQTAVTNPTATLTVLVGQPAELAVLVDSTNFDNPTWQPFTTNPVVPLPDADGEHLVWVALRGRVNATDWQGFGVTLDRVAPPLVITSPTNGTTSKPVLQVTGFSTSAVWSVSCTLSNATGVQTNLSAFVTGTDFGSVTTKHFQVFDVALTNGVNGLTLRVADLAGNMTTTNFSVTLATDDDNLAPVFTLVWPQTGARLGTDAFTLRGRLDDETAEVQVQVTGASGATNLYATTVERNGSVWVEGVAVEAGTNWLTVTATDFATNTFTTNFMVLRSDVTLTIEEPADVNAPFVSVSGTVSDSSYSVWVNGILASMNGLSWQANNVPVTPGGSAVFNVTAIPEGGPNTPGTSDDPSLNNPVDANAALASLQPEKAAEVELVHGEWSRHEETIGGYEGINHATDWVWSWDEKTGGHASVTWTQFGDYFWANGINYWIGSDGVERFEHWTNTPTSITSTDTVDLESVYWTDFRIKGPLANGHWANCSFSGWGDELVSETAQNIQLELRTGGRDGLQRQNLLSVTGWAQRKTSGGWMDIAKPEIIVPIFGQLDANGQAYAALSDHTNALVTPAAPAGYYRFDVTPAKHRFKIMWNGSDISVASNSYHTVIVGAGMTLTGEVEGQPAGSVLTNIEWQIGGKTVAGFYTSTNSGNRPTNGYPIPLTVTNEPSIHYYWYDEVFTKVKCDAAIRMTNGAVYPLYADTYFDVSKPEGRIIVTTGEIAVDSNVPEEDLALAPIWLHFGCPTNPGVVVSNTLHLSTNIGQVEWVQKANTLGKWETNGVWSTPSIKSGLDSEPYPRAGEAYEDSPRFGIKFPTILEERTGAGDFEVFLMFRPVGTDTIAVPLRRVNWFWSGHAINISGNWQLISTNCTHSIDPEDQPANDFPEWSGIVERYESY